MDTSTHQKLMQDLAALAARPDLQSEFPEQFRKHWENQGKNGRVQIFTATLVDHPCDITLSLFFSGETVIQTGILIKLNDKAAINEVRKGDAFDFQRTQRIDPVAILRELVTPITGQTPDLPADSTSFTLEVDDDAESEVFRAVEHLAGMTRAQVTAYWEHLLMTNLERSGLQRVSPIIKTWLKKERDRLDLQFLRDVRLLEPRDVEAAFFTAHGRNYAVAVKEMRGGEIREKIDAADPQWWGGGFYAIGPAGTLVRMPHDQKDRVLALKAFDNMLAFPVEEIFVDGRHVYSVIFTAEEAIVWRTRNSDSVPPLNPTDLRVGASKRGLFGKKSASSPAAPQSAPAPPPPKVHPFVLAKAEKLYMESLREKLPDLNTNRQEFMRVLYDSDEKRFAGKPESLSAEIAAVAARALPRDVAAIARETALLQAHITIFYAEKPS